VAGSRICACIGLLALACASPPPRAPVRTAPPPPPATAKPAPPPAAAAPASPGNEKTAADPALQRDVAKLIYQCEQRLGSAGRVIDTRFERLEDPTVVESWIVGRVGGEVVYQVKLTPSEQGVQVEVQCPPSPSVK
jgi:hypothetical protein